MHPAKFWQPKDKSTIKCLLCPRYCEIKEGTTGYCSVRLNKHQALFSTVYKHPSAINVDPVEKKPLYHFMPGTQIFSVGTIGCNLGCIYCQNWNLSRSEIQTNSTYNLDPEKIIEMTLQQQCSSIAFTYNEPTIFAEYVIDISKIAKNNNLKTAMVTNGYISKFAIRDVYRYITAANVDMKGFSQQFYQEMVLGNLTPVLETLKILKDMGIWIEITNLIIPGENDSSEMITELIDWVLDNLGEDTPLHFSAFHPDYKFTESAPTPAKTVENARELALKKGIKFVYTGNIQSKHGNNTYCPECGQIIIERNWHNINLNTLSPGICQCGYTVPGIFS